MFCWVYICSRKIHNSKALFLKFKTIYIIASYFEKTFRNIVFLLALYITRTEACEQRKVFNPLVPGVY